MIHRHLKNLQKTLGFAVENAKPEQIVKILCRSFITSDESDFYTYIPQFTSIYLEKAGIAENFTHNFLVLHHEDMSADIYVNDLPICVEFLSKRDVKKDELIYESDIADIRRLRFEGIQIKNTDHIIFCFKYGWRFGLFFDLTFDGKPESKLDLAKLSLDLGAYYKKLAFHYLFTVIEKTPYYEEMRKDGWFPYIELLGANYRQLSEAYANKFDFPEKVKKLINSFDKKRIEQIVAKWWKNTLYAKKKKIIETGINAYIKDDDEGFISCIKVLYPEIEGILSFLYFGETNKYTNDSPKLLEHLKQKGIKRTGSIHPILFPEMFSNFLQEYLFPRFDLVKNETSLSRHTSSHGIAEPEAYTKIRALQAILILDQIYFFIPPQK